MVRKAKSNEGWNDVSKLTSPLSFFPLLSVFFSCVSFSIILPSLQPYLSRNGASAYFYGSTVAIYSVGEMIGAILFGKVYERMTVYSKTGAKATLLMCIAFGIVGSFMYVIGDVVTSPWTIFWGRALQGLWTGGKQVVEQTYLSETAPADRVTELTTEVRNCEEQIDEPGMRLFCEPS